MKKIIGITLLAVALVGCGQTSGSNSYNTPSQNTIQEYSPPVTTKTIDDIFVETIDGEYPEVKAEYGRAWMIDFGKSMCEAIDNGLTIYKLALLADEYGVSPEMLGYITGVSITAYCPRNQWFFK